ncbi:hypothetical protein M885DRAFT_506902 [Pelagophyceae sp. CCMP2097]|nr:hypothetical protein M885DRAFT_506902 [Pelagophyceae sp. CCMP2097]
MDSEWEFTVNFDLGAFCPALRGASEEVLEGTLEVILAGIDTGREATHDLGRLLPQLEQLRLRNSTLRSFRDIGALEHLRVLHASRCGITDLDGIASLCALEEVYLSFNDIADTTALAFHDALEVLDLESNRIAEEDEGLASLGTCLRLTSLTLLGNPMAARAGYQQLVLRQIPQLEALDDAPIGAPIGAAPLALDVISLEGEDDFDGAHAAALLAHEEMLRECEVVSEAIKAFRPLASPEARSPDRRARAAAEAPRRPGTAPAAAGRHDAAQAERPSSARMLARDGAAYSCWDEMLDLRGFSAAERGAVAAASASSQLTHGDNAQVFSGNIARGMRRRRAAAPPPPHDDDDDASSTTVSPRPHTASPAAPGRRPAAAAQEQASSAVDVACEETRGGRRRERAPASPDAAPSRAVPETSPQQSLGEVRCDAPGESFRARPELLRRSSVRERLRMSRSSPSIVAPDHGSPPRAPGAGSSPLRHIAAADLTLGKLRLHAGSPARGAGTKRHPRKLADASLDLERRAAAKACFFDQTQTLRVGATGA